MPELSDNEQAVLESECDVDVFTGSGPGGQHRNKTRNAVRLHHRPTGLIVTASERRSFTQNLQAAFERLAARLVILRHKPKPRRPTRPSHSSQRKRLAAKRHRATTKQGRGKPNPEA